MSIRAIIFDVGGVLQRETGYTKRIEWETRLGLPHGQLTRLVLDCPLVRPWAK